MGLGRRSSKPEKENEGSAWHPNKPSNLHQKVNIFYIQFIEISDAKFGKLTNFLGLHIPCWGISSGWSFKNSVNLVSHLSSESGNSTTGRVIESSVYWGRQTLEHTIRPALAISLTCSPTAISGTFI